MQNKIIYSFFLILSVLSAGCDKSIIDDCATPIPCNSIIGPAYFYEDSSVYFYEPVFNPNNYNEFIALKIFRPNSWTNIKSVIKYNYVTEQITTVLSDTVLLSNGINFCRFNWSSTGWVVFENCNNNQLYKMHDDGTNLQQITFDGGSFHPNFTFDGTKLFYSNYSTALNKNMGILMDMNTNGFIDTIYEPALSSTYYFTAPIVNNKLICTKSDDNIRIIDENGLVLIEKFQPITLGSGFTGFTYFRNIGTNTNEVMFIAGFNGIYKLSLNNHSVQGIKRSCTRAVISTISISHDGSKILYELDRYDYDDEPCLVRLSSEIHIMNIDGSNDQVLNLP